MKRPSIFEGIFLAAGLVLSAAAALMVFGFWFGLKAAVGVSVFLYLMYLLRRTEGSVGKVSLGILAAALLILGLAPPIGFAHYLLAGVALIWFTRIIYFYSGVIPAMLDGLLCAAALVSAAACLAWSGSLLGCLWVFFLIQAAFVLIPERIVRKPNTRPVPGREIDPFQAALKAAQDALQRL